MDTLAAWIESPDPQTFPYDDVLAAFRAVGKHFVAPELLALLDRARATAPADPQLARFLDTLLDKFDGRFDNPSYLAIDQLALPTTPEGRDRLFVALLADLIRFERAPAAHLELRPEPRTADKRCHHALRAMQPALDRLGMTGDVLGQLTPAERRRLALTLVPVSTVHDEYLFIRVLQAYESTFALIAAQLAAAVAAIDARDASTAAAEIAAAAAVFRESKPLFSLIGTLQPEA
ncbi:MAG: hypothetical protein QOG77_3795, partial [Solirubrobacteraceae bacterium]|nr:hypothetical protein [Solirubrobacteraceae bacterium]